MAIPPDPLDEVLPKAAHVVMGQVTKLVSRGKQAPLPKPEHPGMADLPGALASQVVELIVDEVLYGDANVGDVLTVQKPEGTYVLSEGNGGPFLLGKAVGQGHPVILGRYGPDSYTRTALENALKNHGMSS